MEIRTNIFTPKTSISSLEQPLKPAIMRRIDRIVKLAKARERAAGNKGELLRLAAEYADCKWMQNTARQVAREAEEL